MLMSRAGGYSNLCLLEISMADEWRVDRIEGHTKGRRNN